jgi:hypothetical protein
VALVIRVAHRLIFNPRSGAGLRATANTLARRHRSCASSTRAMTRSRKFDAPSPSKGFYANYFEVGHTAFEFVIDFGQRYADKQAACHTRIVTSPVYARALLATLGKSLDEHAVRFGRCANTSDERPKRGHREER